MMKKITVILLLSILTIATITPLVIGGNTDTINVTLNPQATADIEINQPSWSPSAALGGTEQTSISWATLSNVGQVQVDVTVKANNTASWTLAGSPSHNTFSLKYLTSGSEQEFEKWLTYDSADSSSGSEHSGQTFTSAVPFTFTKLSFYGQRSGTVGTCYIKVYATSGGLPTGAPLSTTTFTDIGTSLAWYTYTLSTPVSCSANTMYAFEIYPSSNSISIYYRYESPTYGGGTRLRYTTSWSTQTGDLTFKTIGTGTIATNLTTSPATFVSNLSPVSGSNTYAFGLKIQMPTSSSTNTNQETEITFTATAD